MATESNPLVIAITGATGAVWGLSLIKGLLSRKSEPRVPLTLLISQNGRQVVETETDASWDQWLESFKTEGDVEYRDLQDFSAPVASGSSLTRGMVIAPCSMGTLARIAAGVSGTLIERAADVTLKERRPLILLTRETPLSLIHLKNMKTVAEAGGIIMPPVPSFYNRPQTIEEIVLASVTRVCDILGLPLDGAFRWGAGNKGVQ